MYVPDLKGNYSHPTCLVPNPCCNAPKLAHALATAPIDRCVTMLAQGLIEALVKQSSARQIDSPLVFQIVENLRKEAKSYETDDGTSKLTSRPRMLRSSCAPCSAPTQVP